MSVASVYFLFQFSTGLMLKKRTKWEITKTKSKKGQKENEKIEKKKTFIVAEDEA